MFVALAGLRHHVRMSGETAPLRHDLELHQIIVWGQQGLLAALDAAEHLVHPSPTPGLLQPEVNRPDVSHLIETHWKRHYHLNTDTRTLGDVNYADDKLP